MISDEAIAEVRALEEARRAQYLAERKRAATRDELDAILREHINYRDHDHRRAVEAVIDKGWRPPPRVIYDVDDLDALPSGSAVRDSRGRVWFRADEGGKWVCGYVQRDSDWFGGDHLTVLSEPEETGR